MIGFAGLFRGAVIFGSICAKGAPAGGILGLRLDVSILCPFGSWCRHRVLPRNWVCPGRLNSWATPQAGNRAGKTNSIN